MKGLLAWIIVVGSMLIGMAVSIVFLAGVAGMIWGAQAFQPHKVGTLPHDRFVLTAISVVIPLGAFFGLCAIALPLLAKFDFPIDRSQGFYAGLASVVRRLSSRYVALMDKILEHTSEKK